MRLLLLLVGTICLIRNDVYSSYHPPTLRPTKLRWASRRVDAGHGPPASAEMEDDLKTIKCENILFVTLETMMARGARRSASCDDGRGGDTRGESARSHAEAVMILPDCCVALLETY